MISATAVNSSGLLLDIIGAILLFKFGLPPDFDPTGTITLAAEGFDPEERAKGDRYRCWGRIGLVLLIAGFALQLASNYPAWINRLFG